MGERVSDEVVVAAPIDTVWNTITDLATYPQWADGVLETEVLTTDGDGYPETARFRVDARVAEIAYVLRYTYDDYDIRWTLVEGETISQLDGAYDLAETDGGTHVRYRLEADVDLPLPGFLKKRAAKTILDQGLRGLKQRAEAQD
ncbi:SRPBCC family protein [Egicoccus sp. AB-alg2]|uniref:SRPBCC family protein n=1 Tax=Egicoccus sp. AB-alg2 TaxID=3242693 RepID=UPI00359DFFB7